MKNEWTLNDFLNFENAHSTEKLMEIYLSGNSYNEYPKYET